MTSEQDREFCTATDCAGYKQCLRALTPEVSAEAKESGLPFSGFASNPMCYKPTKKEETKK